MESAASPVPGPSFSVSCSTGCRYAEPMQGSYSDWVWCTRPGAPVRLRQLGEDCWPPVPRAVVSPLNAE